MGRSCLHVHSMTFSDESLNGLCGFVRTTGRGGNHEQPACAGAHPARGAPTAMNPRRCWRRGARLDAGRRVCARADRFVSAMASQAFCRWLSATYRDVSFPQPLATRAGYHRRPDGHRAATPDIGAATTTSRLRGPRSSHFLCLGGPAPAPSCDLPPISATPHSNPARMRSAAVATTYPVSLRFQSQSFPPPPCSVSCSPTPWT